MALTSHSAVQELKGIFPSWDADTLDIMLQQHGGNIEQTVSTLCSMAEDGPSDATATSTSVPATTGSSSSSGGASSDVTSSSSSAPATTPAPAPQTTDAGGDEALARRLQNQLNGDGPMDSYQLGRAAAPRMNGQLVVRQHPAIPDNFLQIPGEVPGDANSAADFSDALVAKMMQDEIILARRQQMQQQQSRFHAAGGLSGSPFGVHRRPAAEGPPGPTLSEKFAVMKKDVTKKFDNLFKKEENPARARSRFGVVGDDDDDDENEQLISFDSDMQDDRDDVDEWGNKKKD